jgi:hypothetical protein
MTQSVKQWLASSRFSGIDKNVLKKLFDAILADLTAVRAPLAGLLQGSAVYNAASLADGEAASSTITVTGAALGDFAVVSAGVDLAGITCTAYVSAANTVTFRLQNESGGAVDLASTTFRALVFPQASVAAAAALTLAE